MYNVPLASEWEIDQDNSVLDREGSFVVQAEVYSFTIFCVERDNIG